MPIAAPSANISSHISPTEAVHVFNDFYDKNVNIIDGGSCDFGIESTVVKLVEKEDKIEIEIIRTGSVSTQTL